MSKTIILAINPLEPETWTTHEVESVCEFLKQQFNEWPETARIYKGQVSLITDVTPFDKRSIEALENYDEDLYVVVYPALPVAAVVYVIIALLVITAIAIIAAKKIPNAASRNMQSSSANNELSERVNKPRLNGRIPDIYGTVRSTPDLIALPYKIFEDNVEVEYSYMCIGRGEYEVSDVRDDTTSIASISGSAVEIYGPNTSPNFGTPQMSIGSPINTPVLNVSRLNSVNGQILLAPNDSTIVGNANIRFSGPNFIQLQPLSVLDFTKEFEVGDHVTVTNSSFDSSQTGEQRTIDADPTGWFKFPIPSSTLPSQYQAGKQITIAAGLFNNTDGDGFVVGLFDLSGVYTILSVTLVTVGPQNYCKVTLDMPDSINAQWNQVVPGLQTVATLIVAGGTPLFNLDGTYEITAVTQYEITLLNPSTVNSNWTGLGTTAFVSPTLSASATKWIGPFVMTSNAMNEVFCNFVASNGLYKDDGKNQIAANVSVELELVPVDSSNAPIGPAELFTATVQGSSKTSSERAYTLKAVPTFTGRCTARCRRTTLLDKEFKGQVVDEIKWRDLYSVANVSVTDFGNVTTVQSVTVATNGALAVKERKLNMLVTRKLPARISGSNFTTELYSTNSADDILSAICLDQRIGNRSIAEIDFDSIYNTIAEVKEYFGFDEAGEFCYTFDNDNVSFEESVKMIADAAFCTAFRRGNIIKLNFEKETQDSTLLFNHRNKLPNSETRAVSFGNQEKFDGVSFQYIDPNDDAIITYYIPEDQSAINPKEIESVGIRSGAQAYMHAWRNWNKIVYQNIVTEFDATQEANLLAINDRILVADNTRSETQDGQIESQDGLTLNLSVSVDLTKASSYTIFVQYPDGVTEGLPLVAGSVGYQVLLQSAPRIPLALDDELYAKTTFVIVGNSDTIQTAFLVTEKSPKDGMTSSVTAMNYDSRYYANDSDYLNGVIDENGNFI